MDTTATETLLAVEGMTCGSCIRHVTTALRGVDGVGQVQVSLKDGQARVTHDAAQAPVGALVEALREAGYGATPRAG